MKSKLITIEELKQELKHLQKSLKKFKAKQDKYNRFYKGKERKGFAGKLMLEMMINILKGKIKGMEAKR